MILVKTLRNEPGSPHRIRDASKFIIEVKFIDFKKEYPRHYLSTDLIWITEESKDYIHFIINPSLFKYSNLIATPERKAIVNIAMNFNRNSKLDLILSK